MKPPTWQELAACRHMDTTLFYPDQGEVVPNQCIEACNRCPVTAECLDWALTYETDGWWANTSARQRARHRKQHGITMRTLTPKLAKCGTPGGYRRHRRHGEPACNDCAAANVRYNNPAGAA